MNVTVYRVATVKPQSTNQPDGHSGTTVCYQVMLIHFQVRGGGRYLDDYIIYESDVVPRVGDSVCCDELFAIEEKLGIEQTSWVVKSVEWLFGEHANEMGTDVTVDVSSKEYEEAS